MNYEKDKQLLGNLYTFFSFFIATALHEAIDKSNQ